MKDYYDRHAIFTARNFSKKMTPKFAIPKFSYKNHAQVKEMEPTSNEDNQANVAEECPKYEDVGRKFLADMINRFFFFLTSLLTITLIIVWGIVFALARNEQLEEIRSRANE